MTIFGQCYNLLNNKTYIVYVSYQYFIYIITYLDSDLTLTLNSFNVNIYKALNECRYCLCSFYVVNIISPLSLKMF